MKLFSRIATKAAEWLGTPIAFSLNAFAIVIWACFGPPSHFSDTWQLVVNTATTVLTYLFLFLVQYTQNRSDQVTQLKLNELIRSIERARNPLIDAENLTDEEISDLINQLQALAQREKKVKPLPTEGNVDN